MSDERAVVRLDSIAAYAAAIPELLGFVPAESLVVTAMRGTEIVVTARQDLPTDRGDHGDCVHSLLCRLVHANVDGLMVAVVTEAPGRRVFADLVDAIAAGGIEVHDAVLVRNGRVWSYFCEDADCCPPEGVPFEGSGALRAANVLLGIAPFADREAMVATVQRSAQATQVESLLANSSAAALPNLDRFIDPRATLTIEEAAAAVRALADARVRDDLVGQLETREDATLNMLSALLPLAPAGYDADVCACYALAVYLRGRWVLAQAAVDRALEAAPTHGLALLVNGLLAEGVPPKVVRRVMFSESSR